MYEADCTVKYCICDLMCTSNCAVVYDVAYVL